MARKVREVAIEGDLYEERDELLPFQYSITAYGADYPVDGLVRRIQDGDIHVPDFQRGYVWTPKKASRFIESLLLGLPVPGIFLSRESDSNRLLVIDGQQRLRTLQWFYEGVFPPTRKLFALTDVQKQFVGLTYKTLPDEDRRRLDDSIIHATIVRQDEPSQDNSSIYYLFERLNTGGTLLEPQEIRASIYHGKLQDLISSLNRNTVWREIYGPISPRLRDQELILRFLALLNESDKYRTPIKEFLNDYMGRHRNPAPREIDRLMRTFEDTIELVGECLGTKAFKPKRTLNAAVFDSVMVGVARRLAVKHAPSCTTLKQAYDSLLADTEYASLVSRTTANQERVRRRLELATGAFAATL